MVPKMELIRVAYTPEGTHGILKLNGQRMCYTLEPPWKDNKRNVSCIPEGTYKGRFQRSGSFPNFRMYFQDVPGRTRVMFHWGNQVKNTQGCPLLGDAINTKEMFIYRTKDTVHKVEAQLTDLLPLGKASTWDIHVTSV